LREGGGVGHRGGMKMFMGGKLVVGLLLIAVGAQAQLEFAEPKQVLPVVAGALALDARFEFTNKGTTPVKILKVVAACGCTTPEVAKTEYAPGEKGVVVAHFDIGQREGPQHKTVAVSTDAGEHLLEFTVELPKRAEITPQLVIFREGEVGPKEVTATFLLDTPVVLMTPPVIAAPFTVSVEEKAAGEKYAFAVKVVGTPAEAVRGAFAVRVKGASGKVYEYNVFVRYAP
jgi:hypothetical protein